MSSARPAKAREFGPNATTADFANVQVVNSTATGVFNAAGTSTGGMRIQVDSGVVNFNATIDATNTALLNKLGGGELILSGTLGFIMSALEAKDYGIVDEVISNRELASVAVPAGVS